MDDTGSIIVGSFGVWPDERLQAGVSVRMFEGRPLYVRSEGTGWLWNRQSHRWEVGYRLENPDYDGHHFSVNMSACEMYDRFCIMPPEPCPAEFWEFSYEHEVWPALPKA